MTKQSDIGILLWRNRLDVSHISLNMLIKCDGDIKRNAIYQKQASLCDYDNGGCDGGNYSAAKRQMKIIIPALCSCYSKNVAINLSRRE